MGEEYWKERFSKLDLERECSALESSCWLCDELENWNSVLNALRLHLTEWQVGRIQLCTLAGRPSEGSEKLNILYNATFFLLWLPKKHDCINAIVLGRGYSQSLATPVPDFIARRASNLCHIAITGDSSFDWAIVLDALSPIQKLEALQVRSVVTFSRRLASTLAEILLANSSSVRTVDVSDIILSCRASDILVNSISKCENLEQLTLGVCLQPSGLRDFTNLLQSTQTLHNLHLPQEIMCNEFTTESDEDDDVLLEGVSLEVPNHDLFDDPFTTILTVLESNNAVTCLTISGCDMDPIHIDSSMGALLKSVLSKNKTLRSLSLQGCCIDSAGARQISEGLRENGTLKCLDVSVSDVQSLAAQILCSALKQNASLTLLKIGFCLSTSTERKALTAELARNQWYGRVQLHWIDADVGGLISALSDPLLCPTELKLDTSEFSSDTFSALCSALASSHCVKDLTVYLPDVATLACVFSLRSALEENRSLRYLELHDGYRNAGVAVMALQGLYCNKYITDLEIIYDVMSVESAELLATLLTTNTNIHRLVLMSRLISKSGLTHDSIDVISQGLHRNLFITEVIVDCITPPIRLAIQRNVSFLHRAASFVLRQNVGKSCAEAFELLESKASLISCLKSTSGISETEAKTAIQAARRFIWSNYLFITQVVCRKLECYAGEGTQIDELNTDCWVAIAKHLKISDICN